MQAVFERLVAELEKTRPLTAQSLRHLAGTYGVGRDETGTFVDQQLPELSDEELDLTLASLFTPKLADQAPFADLLRARSIPPSEWPTWIERLHTRPTLGCLVTEEGSSHHFPLRPVTLERYFHRLRLDGSVPEPLLDLILTQLPPDDHALVLAIARRAIWNTTERQAILIQFLTTSRALDLYRRADVEALLTLMESAEPTRIDDIRTRLPDWERTLRTQLTTGAMPSPFFNLQVEEMHGGGRDHRPANTGAADRQRAELEFLGRLARSLEAAQ